METAGAGQTDVEVSDLVHTTVIVLMPGVGDEVQALKAGLFEVADIFVVNKADIDDADRVVADLRMMLELVEEGGEWTPPVLKAVALHGEGVSELADYLERHLAFLHESDRLKAWNRRRVEKELMIAVSETLLERARGMASLRSFGDYVDKVLEKELSPKEAAVGLLKDSS